ncbi:hypothetical protein JZ751_014696 [Albula glossodonta]|uniref:PH domain-containing protein n=1 Tax=Albula glossodonta TaxID=121402 RepID=A0A8T2N437_9TELE|nr:hypothetical protein JZ751_014696 [Albula glossodonta]
MSGSNCRNIPQNEDTQSTPYLKMGGQRPHSADCCTLWPLQHRCLSTSLSTDTGKTPNQIHSYSRQGSFVPLREDAVVSWDLGPPACCACGAAVTSLPLCQYCSMIHITLSQDVDSFVLTIDIREIKEIRAGQKSRDFERYVEDSAARPDQAHCFVILYGTEFRLKALSLAAMSDDEMNMWVKGLTSLVSDTLQSPTPLQVESPNMRFDIQHHSS